MPGAAGGITTIVDVNSACGLAEAKETYPEVSTALRYFRSEVNSGV